MTHLFGLKASMPTSSYFFFASFASCLIRLATYSSSSILPAMVLAIQKCEALIRLRGGDLSEFMAHGGR